MNRTPRFCSRKRGVSCNVTFMSEMTEQERMRRWVETWKQAGPELDRIKEDELRAMNEESSARHFDDLALPLTSEVWRKPEQPEYNGMVEQQRLFQKWWEPRMIQRRKSL